MVVKFNTFNYYSISANANGIVFSNEDNYNFIFRSELGELVLHSEEDNYSIDPGRYSINIPEKNGTFALLDDCSAVIDEITLGKIGSNIYSLYYLQLEPGVKEIEIMTRTNTLVDNKEVDFQIFYNNQATKPSGTSYQIVNLSLDYHMSIGFFAKLIINEETDILGGFYGGRYLESGDYTNYLTDKGLAFQHNFISKTLSISPSYLIFYFSNGDTASSAGTLDLIVVQRK